MSATNWSKPIDWPTVSRRAAGRRRYNSRRTSRVLHRRFQASQLLEEVGYPLKRGWQSELARRLGVHRSTICRDFAPFNEAFRLGITVQEVETLRRETARLERRRRRGQRW